MTKDEIMNMPAGIEMDQLIALHVFGEIFSRVGYLPKYSTDEAAAWQVIEKLKEIKPILNYEPSSKKWYMRFNGGSFCSDESAALAICRTALIENL